MYREFYFDGITLNLEVNIQSLLSVLHLTFFTTNWENLMIYQPH